MHATQGARSLVWLFALLFSNAVWGQDFDRDGIPDAQDNCMFVVNADQADADGDGHGNGCECGDFNRDGRVDTTDARLTQRCAVDDIPCEGLCDANGDGACNTTDARQEQRLAVGQLTKGALSCRQRPAAPDVDDDGDGFTELEGDCDDASKDVFPGAPVTTGNPPVPTGCFALRAPVEPPVRATGGCAGLLEGLSDNPTDEAVGAGQCPNAVFGTGDLGNLRACDQLQLCYGTCGRSQEACNEEFRESLRQICNNLPAGQDTACQAGCLVVAEQYVATVEQAGDTLWLEAQSQACRCCPDRSVPACGDGTCNGSETCGTCPGDCGSCPLAASCVTDDDCESDSCGSSGECERDPCGDGFCAVLETCYAAGCQEDCGACGDGTPCGANADCASGICNGGFCIGAPQPAGVPCTTDAACRSGQCRLGFCMDEGGSGDPCLVGGDCASGICNLGFCIDEPQPGGAPCSTDAACVSGDCSGNFCSSECGDGRCEPAGNLFENCFVSGCQVDCGRCPNGSPCSTGGDCSSGICNFGFCIGAPQPAGVPCTTDAACDSGACIIPGVCAGICGDGKCEFFGDETCFAEGVLACQADCGKCANGTPCTLNADCRSGICNFGFCIGSPLPAGAPCTTDTACRSNSCTLGFCDALCGDGDCEGPFETCFSAGLGSCQVDCGGCPNGTPCTLNADCASDICNFAFCIGSCLGVGAPCTTDNACCGAGCGAGLCEASCGDGSCSAPLEICGSGTGGLKCQPDCGKCPNGAPCLSGSDCNSGICTAGFCTACKTVGASCTSDAECCVGCAIPPYETVGACL